MLLQVPKEVAPLHALTLSGSLMMSASGASSSANIRLASTTRVTASLRFVRASSHEPHVAAPGSGAWMSYLPMWSIVFTLLFVMSWAAPTPARSAATTIAATIDTDERQAAPVPHRLARAVERSDLCDISRRHARCLRDVVSGRQPATVAAEVLDKVAAVKVPTCPVRPAPRASARLTTISARPASCHERP